MTIDTSSTSPADLTGGFNIQPPAQPQGTETFNAVIPTVFNWDYSVQREDLRKLYEKSKDSMWNARTDLAWDTDVDPQAANTPDEWIPIFGTPL